MDARIHKLFLQLRNTSPGIPSPFSTENHRSVSYTHLDVYKRQGKKSVDSIHKELGHIMWEYVGMGRTAEGLKEGLKKLKEVRKAVSYTHLDVYKRQSLCSPMTA